MVEKTFEILGILRGEDVDKRRSSLTGDVGTSLLYPSGYSARKVFEKLCFIPTHHIFLIGAKGDFFFRIERGFASCRSWADMLYCFLGFDLCIMLPAYVHLGRYFLILRSVLDQNSLRFGF